MKNKQRTHELYGTWSNIKQRCFNSNNPQYPNYGGRGITMCSGWSNSFAAFSRDVGARPAGLTLDRRDNNGHYSCGTCEECTANGWEFNCRWATAEEQCANTRRAVLITIGNVTKPINGWLRYYGIPYVTYKQRVRSGWDVTTAATTPPKHGRTVTHLGKTLTLKEWAKETGLEYKTIVARDRKGEKPPHIFRPSQIKLIEFEGRSMTITDWGRLLGKNISTLRERLNNGQPLVKEDERQLL